MRRILPWACEDEAIGKDSDVGVVLEHGVSIARDLIPEYLQIKLKSCVFIKDLIVRYLYIKIEKPPEKGVWFPNLLVSRKADVGGVRSQRVGKWTNFDLPGIRCVGLPH